MSNTSQLQKLKANTEPRDDVRANDTKQVRTNEKFIHFRTLCRTGELVLSHPIRLKFNRGQYQSQKQTIWFFVKSIFIAADVRFISPHHRKSGVFSLFHAKSHFL